MTNNPGQTPPADSDGLDPLVEKIHKQLTKGLGDREPAGSPTGLPWDVDSTEYDDEFTKARTAEEALWAAAEASFPHDGASPVSTDKKAGGPPAAS